MMKLLLSLLLAAVSIVPQPSSMVEEGKGADIAQARIWCADKSLRPIATIFLEVAEPTVDYSITKWKFRSSVRLSLDASLPEEGYVLDSRNGKVLIKGGSPKGVWWGLQTLREMVAQAEEGHVAGVLINDAPKFAYRGAHFDVVRHFFGVEEVKSFIDMMVMHKLNTFHWHLTDNEGWRIEIKKYPKLTEIGSMRKETVVGHYYVSHVFDGTPHGGFYTQEQIKDIVAYAAARQIEVIPEIEMPGHCLAALASYPYLGCKGEGYEVGRGLGSTPQVFCPGKETTYEFLDDVLDEVFELFPSKYVHIGGDEVRKNEWEKCPYCQAAMEKAGITDVARLQNLFTKRMEDYILSKGHRMIGWDEILEGGVSNSAIVMSWRGTKGGIAAAQLGNDVIMSPSSYCYFDSPQYEDLSDALFMCPGDYRTCHPMSQTYSLDPYAGLNEEEQKHILGVQGNMWTELVPDMDQLYKMELPRAAALSEVAWGTKTDYSDFVERLKAALIPLYKEHGYNYADRL